MAAFDPSTAKPIGFDQTTAKPLAQSTLGQQIGNYLAGVRAGIYKLPQSIVELGARGLDATGMTQNAYKDIHSDFQDADNIANPDQDKFYTGGRAIGAALATVPTLAVAPFSGGGILATAGNAGLQGGVASALSSANSDEPLWKQIGTGAGIGLFGGGALAGIAKSAASIGPSVKPGVQAAMNAGYKLVPRMITDKPGVVADALAGLSGKVKTAQAASAANQDVTNALAAKSLGLPPGTTLSDAVLSGVRQNAGKAYQAMPKAVPTIGTDPQFVSEIQALGNSTTPAAQAFPSLMKNQGVDDLVDALAGNNAPKTFSTDAGMQLVRQLRANANGNFKSIGDPSKLDLAFAQRGAADAIDDLIQRNLAASGQPDLANAYQNARQLIAKSHDVEAATNTATGNVNARKIAQLAARGRPLSGELKTIADTAAAFPKALQSEAAFGEAEPLSVLDVAAGAAALPHNPGLLATVLSRPLARKTVLSDPMQKAMLARATAPLPIPKLTLPAIQAAQSLPKIPVGLFGNGLNLIGQNNDAQ